jgi:putative tryptophan/tyrosine transport system substrate-binding protein
MKRREFITLLGGAAVAPSALSPLAARAQQGERIRRIAVFLPSDAADPESLSRVTALSQGLQELGWTDGRNLRIDFRFGAGNAEQYRKMAADLIALAPDVPTASTSPAAV